MLMGRCKRWCPGLYPGEAGLDRSLFHSAGANKEKQTGSSGRAGHVTNRKEDCKDRRGSVVTKVKLKKRWCCYIVFIFIEDQESCRKIKEERSCKGKTGQSKCGSPLTYPIRRGGH